MAAILDRAEATDLIDDMYRTLAELPVEDFVHAVFFPDINRPRLASRLPRLPSEQIQRNYVGEAGVRLEHMTAAFVGKANTIIRRRFGDRKRDLRILDYGCGWGRILRMMPYFTDTNHLYAVDPVQESLDLCVELDVPAALASCDPIPTSIPFPGTSFDVVYAFSVFTHLSERTARAVLSAVRERMSSNGCFILTVRPVEFWTLVESVFGKDRTEDARRRHLANEYAFLPVDHLNVGGEATFGDASWSLPFMAKLADDHGWQMDPNWERSLVDPFQIVVTLYTK